MQLRLKMAICGGNLKEQNMTKKEAILISAYTGYLLTKNFSDVHLFCQELLERPIYTHEFADKIVQVEIQEKCLPLIKKMIENEGD